MRILMCNSFHYLRGGAERCFFDLSDLLRAKGHDVIPFCMKHEKNYRSDYEAYFVEKIDYPHLLQEKNGLRTTLRAVKRTIYSAEAKTQIERLIQDTRPDIVHVHGIAHEISPSILPAIKGFGLPVVQTLHDYKLLCPNTSFVSNGQVCERCFRHRYYNVIRYRCKRGSLAASTLAGVETYVHKLLQIYERNVDVFIAPSQFLHDKLVKYGIKNQAVHLPNFIDVERVEPSYRSSDYFAYSGRLVTIKGMSTLMKAMRQINRSHLHVFGEGELLPSLKAEAEQHGMANVTFHGHLEKEALLPFIRNAAFTIVPSEWYENYPMAILESLALGTPVIGSRIGGIAEMIQDGETGLLFDPGNAGQLAEKIVYLLDHPEKASEMGRAGRQLVARVNNPETHYRQTMAVYQSLTAEQSVPAGAGHPVQSGGKPLI